MSKVSLTLVGVESNIVEKETRKALAELYSKPESHFDIHCEHLFQSKKPYKLIAQIDAAEAELHRERLEQMGILCEVAALGSSLSSSGGCLLYTSPSSRDRQKSRMPSSA